jgi:hypothetical protein
MTFQTGAFQASAFQGGQAAVSTRPGFEMVWDDKPRGIKALLVRVLEERRPKVVPKPQKARKAREIVLEGAKLALEPDATQEDLKALVKRWKPLVELPKSEQDPFLLFLAQIAIAVRQMEEEEEETAIALLLMH